MTVLDLEAIRKRAAAARDSAGRLIDCAFGNERAERPRLSIPARPDRDDDLLVCDALDEIDPLCDELERRRAENAKLRADVDGLAWMLAEWVVDVSDKGSGWDDWDENYKDAGSRPGPFREILDKAIEEVRKMRGGDDLALRGGEPARSET